MKAFAVYGFLLLIIGATVYFGLLPWTEYKNYVIPISSLLPQSDNSEQTQPEEESEFPAFLTLIAICSGLGALLRGSPGSGAICLISCLILLLIDYHWVLVTLLFIFVLIPMGLVAIVSSLFKRN